MVPRFVAGAWSRRWVCRLSVVVAAWLCSLSVAIPAVAVPGLTQVRGSPFATGDDPISLAFGSNGLLAVVNFLSNTMSLFSVRPDGTVMQVPGSPVAASEPASVAFTADGKLLAIANNLPASLNTVSILSVGPAGVPTAVGGSPFSAGASLSSVAFSPDGRLLATANTYANDVWVYSVGSDGTLAPIAGSPFIAPNTPAQVAFSPDGRLLAAADYPAGLSMFAVASSGVLTPASGSPYTFGAVSGLAIRSAAFSPDGRLVAGTGTGTGTVMMFSIRSGGALTVVPGSPFRDGPATSQDLPFNNTVAFSPNGQLLATANSTPGTVSLLRVTSTGALVPVVGSPFPVGFDATQVAFSADSRLLATINYASSGAVAVFALAPDLATQRPDNHFTISHVRPQPNGKISFSATVPGPGKLDVLETARKDNLASVAMLLHPARGRFVFARAHRTVRHAGTIPVTVIPNARGRLLVAHHTYQVTLRLWVSYTPTAGKYRSVGFYGLHLPSACVDPDHDGDCDTPR